MKKLLTLIFPLFCFISYAQDRYVDPAGVCGGNTPCHTTITAAMTAAAPGDVIQVGDGTYNENLDITQNVTLISENGRATTTIQGTSRGPLEDGTIFFPAGSSTTDVQIGALGQGFTLIGFDLANPANDIGVVYMQGTHGNISFIDNEIQANGEGGITAEYNNLSVTNLTIDNNSFTGQTFVGAMPAECGFGNQFTVHNVPRQLVTLNPGTYGVVNFTNNMVTGIAGGDSSDGCGEQGNSLVTIDADNAFIDGNLFNGTTARFGASLRNRGSNATITNNCFYNDGLRAANAHLNANQNPGGEVSTLGNQTIDEVAAQNAFFNEGWYHPSAPNGLNYVTQTDPTAVLGGTWMPANSDCAAISGICAGGCLPAAPVIPTMSQWATFLFALSIFTVFIVGLYNMKKSIGF